MKRKRMKKLLMSAGVSRNEATVYADTCGPDMPHSMMALLVVTQPELRELVRGFLTSIMQGTALKIEFYDASEEAEEALEEKGGAE